MNKVAANLVHCQLCYLKLIKCIMVINQLMTDYSLAYLNCNKWIDKRL